MKAPLTVQDILLNLYMGKSFVDKYPEGAKTQRKHPYIEEATNHLYQAMQEVIGEDEKSHHVRRFQCPNYEDCREWAEQWKMNSEPPYCSVDGRKMKSVEFDEPEGDDWQRNELRDEQRTRLNKLFGRGEAIHTMKEELR